MYTTVYENEQAWHDVVIDSCSLLTGCVCVCASVRGVHTCACMSQWEGTLRA